MSYSVIPVYRQTAFGRDLQGCSMLRGVQKTVRIVLGRGAGVRIQNPDNPDQYELVGHWAATDETPASKRKPEWKGHMRFTKYIRGVMRDKRAAKNV